MTIGSYVRNRLLLCFFIYLFVFVFIFLVLDVGFRDIGNVGFINLLKVITLEFPVAGVSAIATVYMFMLTDNKISSFRSMPNAVNLFLPSVIFSVVIFLLIVFSHEIAIPQLVKRKVYADGVFGVSFLLKDRNVLVFAKTTKLDTKTQAMPYYSFNNITLISLESGFTIASRLNGKYYLRDRKISIGNYVRQLEGNLEKVILYFAENTHFFTIWEFSEVKDSFNLFALRSSRINYVMYEKIYVPLISLVMMLFAITIAWKLRIKRNTVMMPIYVLVGIVFVMVFVKVVFYLAIRFFELIVFPL